VTLIDRKGVANRCSSSLGPTRMWRVAGPEALRVRLGTCAQLTRCAGSPTGSSRRSSCDAGWSARQPDTSDTAWTLGECGIDYTEVQLYGIAKFVPGVVAPMNAPRFRRTTLE
jgi:sarcosine oxidase